MYGCAVRGWPHALAVLHGTGPAPICCVTLQARGSYSIPHNMLSASENSVEVLEQGHIVTQGLSSMRGICARMVAVSQFCRIHVVCVQSRRRALCSAGVHAMQRWLGSPRSWGLARV